MKKISITILILLASLVALPQSDLGLTYFGNIFQSTYLNPTARAEHTLSIGLPMLSSVNVQGIHNGFVPKSISYWDTVTDSLIIDPKLIPDALKEQNMLFANAGIEILHVRLKIYNWDFWFATRQNHEVSFFYPKDLFRFAVEGNGSMVGGEIDFTPLGLNASIYREYTVGLSTEMNKWVFGGRLSLLQGLSNAYMKPTSLKLSIDDDMYAHTVNADATLYTSGMPVDFVSTEDAELFSPEFNTDKFGNTDYLIDYFTRFRNPGFALSGGVSYKYDQRTTFTFSFSDVGFISWSDSTKHANISGDATFDGFDALSDYLYNKSFNVDSLIDGFIGNFDDQTFTGAYTTWLSPKFYLMANYQLAKRTNLAVQFYTTVNRKVYPAFTIGASQGLGRAFNLMLSASFNQRTASNFGFGLLVKPGPVQIYMMADNYFFPTSKNNALTFTNVNFRFGINLVFGRVKTQQGLPYR